MSKNRNNGIFCRINARAVSFCLGALLLSAGTTVKEKNIAGGIRTEDMSKEPVQVTVSINPGVIHLDKDAILTIRISAPSEIDVKMPDMSDRLIGFIQNGVLDKEPVSHAGKTFYERQLLLTPAISSEYRLSPFPVVYTDKSKSPADAKWFASRPIMFDTAAVIPGNADKDIDVSMKPVWIYPPFKTVVLYLFLAVLGIALLFLTWKLLKRVRREIQLMRMSPKERALVELAELMARDLVGRNMVKEFYLELTMIVRRYIERAHTIRAPEQTTEEFLEAVSMNPAFSRDVVARLKTFLEAADLVKFAAYHPEKDAIARATDTAKGYVESDAAEKEADNLRQAGTGKEERRK